MGTPKLHHHLPQSYQEGFCRDGRIYVYDRKTDRLRRDQPRNVAAITHDNTIHRDGGVKDTRVEEFLARLDSGAVAITSKLRNRIPLTADERQTYAWYLAFFAARVPRFRRWIDEHETARRKLFDREHLRSPDQLRELIEQSELTDAERAEANAEGMFEMLKSEEYSVSLDHNSKVKLGVETGIELMPRIYDLFWLVNHAVDGAQFITSDNPLVGDPSGHLASFPIAFDTALMLMPTTKDRVHNYDKDMPADIVYLTNIETARASERLILGREEAYLRRIIRDSGVEGTRAEPLVDIGPPPHAT